MFLADNDPVTHNPARMRTSVIVGGVGGAVSFCVGGVSDCKWESNTLSGELTTPFPPLVLRSSAPL